ncbi:Cutinase [Drechslerella dactyloides]|uniref:Cutinase n=1 Tax=Drechslerella dactyloides TaxID=74499 RepID=A0AAD6NIS6_DREDA|nr:Cutinase [Drechslerella dactyloides]
MKFQLLIATFAALATALPTTIEKRQEVGIISSEYSQLGCRPVIFFFARGSGEIGNLGVVVGQPTGNALKTALGPTKVAVEGVDYGALLGTNLLPGGADFPGIAIMRKLFEDAASKCPDSIIVAGGYSQGAALVHHAVEKLSPSTMSKIAAVVTYGDARKVQDNGRIPNFPTEKFMTICNDGDEVCHGTLKVLKPHLDYTRRVPEAVTFLVEKIKAAGISSQGDQELLTDEQTPPWPNEHEDEYHRHIDAKELSSHSWIVLKAGPPPSRQKEIGSGSKRVQKSKEQQNISPTDAEVGTDTLSP